MNELTITVAGWAATDVRMFKGQGDLAIASFRVASTPRYFDREKGSWVDGVTEWFTVRAFRGAAITVDASIRKGMPVVVTGRLRTSTWEAKDGPRVDHIIDATAIGPDCMRGVASFRRATGDPAMSEEDISPAAAAIAASKEGDGGDDAADASRFETEPPDVDSGEVEPLDLEEEPEPVA
ncbi:single-stranded DNA-binding protein [Demequina sp. SYSU T00192]|uniref:Single-stranded DNA-binding protein n=1 Tax=Demequina litoralis TaxID=3051660 RepID=A0ABT8GA15_9MICO|nr:single-stranded DNA-binding protein [Demequina sp. SYSU T00192]MDN4475902.1 single-stranded DNA-binding protein [Demequina sp. SYSU T00192]